MKLLVVSDYYMYVYKGTYYFESQEKCDFFHRYLRVFDELKLATRCIEEETLKDGRVPLDRMGIEYIPLPDFHGPKEYMTSYFSLGKRLKGITEGCQAALLQLPSTVAMRASDEVIKAGIPYATEVVFDAEDAWKSETRLFRKILWKRIDKNMRRICSKADGVACVTEHYLQQHYYSKKQRSFKSNYSSLALDKTFYGNARTYPNGKTLTLAHTANKIFFHDNRKGHRTTIDALATLKRKGIVLNAKFAGAFVDDSPELLMAYADKLGVKEQVEFVGFLNRQQMDEFLTGADLFVLPTMSEGLPRVLIEAMAKGLPCVTTKVSGNSELIQDEYLVEYTDTEGLAQKIGVLAIDKNAYEKASKENYEKSLKYEASILQERRDAYYGELRKLVERKKSL